jgi:flavin reductase (DIM6/NTAB) family NADH-FMN oxidoreductase RutF
MPELERNPACFFTQQVCLIGTYDEDGAPRFAPISWVSYTLGEPACLVVSILDPNKRTRRNLDRTRQMTATIVTADLLPLIERHNRHTYRPELDPAAGRTFSAAQRVAAPLVDGAKFSYECTVIQTADVGNTRTYFARIDAVNMSKEIGDMEFFDLRAIQPVVYSPDHYFTIGEHLGQIGDFAAKE